MKKITLYLLGCCLLIGSIWIYVSKIPSLERIEEDLSSPEGLMKLIPQLKNERGLFEIPNPNEDLEKFLTVRQALINIIESALAKANTAADPYFFAKTPYVPLKLPSHWRAAEVGFVTDAKTIPDFSNGGFGYYAGKSFLEGVVPVKGTKESFYTVPGSAVYMNLMPTSLKCVNRIMETSGLNGGTMLATSYVLGRKNGQAYLIVNGCQNTAKTVTVNNEQLLAPGASSFLGMQWAED
ncbi:MAG: hypothetical protein JSS09_04695 [Verrucomicrobia bacterium]|nr:hypothetical protein [Verrucomicrobiota bacterium]